MKKVLFLTVGISLAALLQNCHKTESSVPSAVMVKLNNTTGLSSTATGTYANYEFLSADGSCAEVAGFSLSDGGTAGLTQYSGAYHQKWRITNVTGDYYTIMNLGSGKFMESRDSSGTQKLVQNSATGANAQLWNLTVVSGKSYKAINKASGLAATANGTNAVQLKPYTGADNQIWGYNALPPDGYRDDEVVQYFRRATGSISFDQVNSIPLSYGANNGKSLWIGEDSFTDNNGGWDPVSKSFPCYGGNQIQFFDVRNSALLQPAGHSWDPAKTANMITHNSTYKYEILPSPDPNNHGGTFTWPGVGVEIGSHVYMYAYEGGGSFNKTVMYDFTENTRGLDWGTAVRHEVEGLSTQQAISYSKGWVKAGDGYIYAYGSLTDFFGGSYMQLARFAESTPYTWQFWDGSNWSSTVASTSESQILLDNGSTKGLKPNASVTYINGKFVLVEMDFGYGCPDVASPHNIYISTSASPTGPFNNRKIVYTIQDRINGVLSNHYVINAHPECTNSKNELLVTYCINYTGCSGVSSCTNNRTYPFYYQAKAVRIPYSIAGL